MDINEKKSYVFKKGRYTNYAKYGSYIRDNKEGIRKNTCIREQTRAFLVYYSNLG